jgi:hypothetical protein
MVRDNRLNDIDIELRGGAWLSGWFEHQDNWQISCEDPLQ